MSSDGGKEEEEGSSGWPDACCPAMDMGISSLVGEEQTPGLGSLFDETGEECFCI